MGTKNMNIAICVNSFHPLVGGCEAVTYKLAEHLSARGHSIFILTRRVAGRVATTYRKFRVIEYLPRDLPGFQARLDQIKPDVVFVYSDVFDFFRHLLTSSKYRLIIALCGANWLFAHKSFVNILYQNTKQISKLICHSVYDRDYKLCCTERLRDKLTVIPNAVDLSEFDNNHISKTTLLPGLDQRFVILNVSNFFPGKGQQHIPDILNLLPDPQRIAYVQVSTDIDYPVGKHLELEWQKLLHTKLKPDIKVVFKKNISREETIGLFRNSNVFVFPTEKEVAPLVILEAMAAELPWVSCDVGSVPGLQGGRCIMAARNAMYESLIDSRVKGLFASAINDLIHKPAIAKSGRLQIEREMTWDKVLPQYESVIEQ